MRYQKNNSKHKIRFHRWNSYSLSILTIAAMYAHGKALGQSSGLNDISSAPSDVVELDKMVVTPSRSSRPLFDAPNTVAVISNEQLERNMFRTTPQILRDTPGILVQETSPGQGSPFIRGFTAFRNIFL
ncbi:MAG: TonB-dependent receptor plug domain-containing protein, partial [Verrucomicrobia bacterium]|nr:TonB-dependent receptor plug domain-containing protein [Verrucomicrobiota bacterium]